MTSSALSAHLLIQQRSFPICQAFGEEYLAQPTQWHARLMLPSSQMPPAWINQPATLIMSTPQQTHRQFSGILKRLTIYPTADPQIVCIDLTLTSKLSLLQTHTSAHLKTQGLAVDLIHQLMSTHHLSYRWQMLPPLPQPEFWRQQPGETDWQFLLHILRQIGGYCWCDTATNGKEQIVFSNHSQTPSPQPLTSDNPTVTTELDIPSGLRMLDHHQGQSLQAQIGQPIEHEWHGVGAYSTHHIDQLVQWRQQAHQNTTQTTLQTCLPDLTLASRLTLRSTPWLVVGIKHQFITGYIPYTQQLTLHPTSQPWRLTPVADTSQPNWSLGCIHTSQRDTRQRYSVTLAQHPQTSPPSILKCALGASPSTPQPVGIHWPLICDTKVILQWLYSHRHQPVIIATLADPTRPSVVTSDNPTQHRLQFNQHTGFILEDAPLMAGIELFTPSSRLSLQHHRQQQHLALQTQGSFHAHAHTHLHWGSQQDLHGKIKNHAQWHADQLLQLTSGRHLFSHSGTHQTLHSQHVKIKAQQAFLRSRKNQRLSIRELQLTCQQSFLGCSYTEDLILHTDRFHLQGAGTGTLVLRGGPNTYLTLLPDGSIHLYAPMIRSHAPIRFHGDIQTVCVPPPLFRTPSSSKLPPLHPAKFTAPQPPTWKTPTFLTTQNHAVKTPQEN
ncbi:MAG: hypothetical protein GKR77_00040 [Legionellales bacterium]|nr:hypothetical protein [Legionellales bacterium]